MNGSTLPASTASPAPAAPDLTACCTAALAVSRQVGEALRTGCAARRLLPLLRAEGSWARQLPAAIGQLAALPPGDRARARDTAAPTLQAWAEQTQENHRLLNRRGLRINTATPYRYRPAKA